MNVAVASNLLMLELIGFKGHPSSCFHYFYTSTGVKIVLTGDLARAINTMIEIEKENE